MPILTRILIDICGRIIYTAIFTAGYMIKDTLFSEERKEIRRKIKEHNREQTERQKKWRILN